MGAPLMELTFLVLSIGFVVTNVNCARLSLSHKLPGKEMIAKYKISHKECDRLCDKNVKCTSTNYNRKFLSCELNYDKGDTLVLVQDPGYVHQEKDFTSGGCTADKSDGSCKITQCESELEVNNGIVRGNMFIVGVKRVVECLPGYKLLSGHRILTCMQNGTWDNATAIQCELVCPLPRNILHGEIDHATILTTIGQQTYVGNALLDDKHLSILNGSEVTYKCIRNNNFYNSSTIKCLDGQWTTYPICSTYQVPCTNNDECTDPGQMCFDSHCRCNTLEQYSYTDKTCVYECKYGLASTFQRNDFLHINDAEYEVLIFTPADECHDECLAETWCKGYETTTVACYLHKVFYVRAGQLTEKSHHTYYRRNCL